MDAQTEKEIRTFVDLVVDGLGKAYREKMKTIPAPPEGKHYSPRIKSVTVEFNDLSVGVSLSLDLREVDNAQ